MSTIYGFLSGGMNIIIVVGGLGLAFIMMINYSNLRGHYTQISGSMNLKNTKTVLNRKTKEIEDQSEGATVTPDTIRELRKNFYHACSLHDALAQLIPLFPLFGILGTVSGLIHQLNSQELAGIFESLHLALGSTFYGLIFAIVLKLLDTLLSSRTINETEILLEDYDRKLENALKLDNLTD